MNSNRFRSISSRSFVRARVTVAVTAVAALVGVVIVAPAAFGAAPDAPGQPTLTAGDSQISVAFTGPVGATAFIAACTPSGGGVPVVSLSLPASPIAVGGLTNSTPYTCTVIALNADGPGPASIASAPVTPLAPTTAPGQPGTPVATASPGKAQITFGLASTGGSPITKYTVACTSLDDSSTLVTKIGSSSPISISLANGTTYTCTVTATNAIGDGPTSAASNQVTPVAATSVPSATRNISVLAQDSQIQVGFAAPLSDGGSGITGYSATCTSSNGGTQGTQSGGGSPITVTGVDDGKTYTCAVFASNGVGNGPPSSASAAVTPSGAPSAPAKPAVAGGDARITVTFSAPAANGGSAITGYTATCTSFNDGTSTSRPSTTVTPITIPNLINGQTYSCTVSARNAVGTSDESPASSSVVPDRGPDTPAAPTALAGNAQIKVSFTAPGTGGSPITGYTARCASVNAGVTGTDTGTGSATSILVSPVTNGRGYRCTVVAKNAKGSSLASAPSVLVIPSTVPSSPGIPGVTPGNGSIKVSFGTPNNGGTAITSYVTSCGSTNGGRAASQVGPTSPLVVTGLTNDKSYRCVVTARNARGNGTRSPASAVAVPSTLLSIQSTQRGFRLFAGDGGVFTFGIDTSFGSAAGIATHTVVGMTSTPDTKGYWLVATDGGIFSFGNAHFWGSTGAMHLNQPIVGMAATPSGHGYWLVASDGGIFSFGDARFWGSTGAIRLNQPIVGMASTPTGHGYWLVASDGGLFSFGDAGFHGAPTGRTHSTVVGMATTAKGGGYWIAAADGSVYNFGDAPAYGGVTVRATRLPIAGIASTPTGHGYWLAAGDGGVFTFGDAPFIGWPGPLVLRQAIRGVNR